MLWQHFMKRTGRMCVMRRRSTPKKELYHKIFEHKIKRKELGYSDIDGQIVDRTYFPINYPLIRLEDVMLMYAEIVGPTDEGVRLVKTNTYPCRAGGIERCTENGKCFLAVCGR